MLMLGTVVLGTCFSGPMSEPSRNRFGHESHRAQIPKVDAAHGASNFPYTAGGFVLTAINLTSPAPWNRNLWSAIDVLPLSKGSAAISPASVTAAVPWKNTVSGG
jgi:hypothetical protein